MLVAACAGTGEREPTRTQLAGEIYQKHAGADVGHVTYSSVRSWYPVGNEALGLEFNGRRHFLINLTAPCDTEIRFAPNIRLLNNQRNRLTTFDRIAVGDQTCRIVSIRPLDINSARAEVERARRGDAETVQSAQDSGGT